MKLQTPAIKSTAIWLLQTIGAVVVSWLSRMAIWKWFMKDKEELEYAPQP